MNTSKITMKENNVDMEVIGIDWASAISVRNDEMKYTFVPSKRRGFEIVRDEFRKYPNMEIELPKRGDSRSAGYDIKTPVEIILQPNEKKLIFTDIKAYMLEDEVLELHVRSSIGVKKGVILSNITGIIDSSYYENKDNDGNIGLSLWNTSNDVVKFDAQERICQCIFKKYLTTDCDECINSERTGGFGSSGRK